MLTVNRFDFGRLNKSTPVAGGGARMTARITRSGVFLYRRGDGTTRREYRPPSEVFHKDSLASLSYVPITDGHPKGQLDSSNWKRLSIGTGGAEARQDGIYVDSDIIVRDGGVLDRLDSGDLQETSAGYECRIEMQSGTTPEGERYDCIQRDIRYNHVALGRKGWGRAGDTHVKLDSNDAIAIEDQPKESPTMLKFTIDGIVYDVNTPQFIQALEKREDGWKQEKALLTSERDTAKGEASGLQTKLDETTTKQDSKDEDFEKRVASLVTIRTDSQATLGDSFDYSGKSELDIMRAVILKKDDKSDLKDASDDFIRGTYNAIKGTSVRTDGSNGTHKKIASALSFDKGEYKEDAAPAHAPGMGPLSVSKDQA